MSTQGDAIERLGDGIVQLARKALPLLDRGQLACLGVETSVLDCDGCLVGESQCQFSVMIREMLRVAVMQGQHADDLVTGNQRDAHPRTYAGIEGGKTLAVVSLEVTAHRIVTVQVLGNKGLPAGNDLAVDGVVDRKSSTASRSRVSPIWRELAE